MREMTRRALLRSTALVPVAAVVACAGQTAAGLPAQLLSDVQTLASGVAGILPTLGAVAGIPAATVSQVGGDIAELQQAAGTLSGVATTTAAQPVVQQIEGYVNAIVGIAAPLLAATPAGPILAAATVLLPVIEAAVGLVLPPSAPPAAVAAAASQMTPAQARLILAAARRGR